MYKGDARAPGAEEASGNWDPGYNKGECGPNGYMAGLAIWADPVGATIRAGGASIFCCDK